MSINPQSTVLGFIGTGVMGRSMCGHLLSAGYRVHVYSRTRSRAQPLIDQGAIWADTPADVAANAQVIITIVGFPTDVEQVYLGENGLLSRVKEGAVLIDMTTSSPERAVRIAAAAAEKGAAALDAPVSGGDRGAREATLSIMVGGDRQAFDRVRPILEVMGKNIVYQGPAGSGQHTKMANQIAIAAGMIGVCEALAYARRAGLDPQNVLRSIEHGAAGSWSLSNLGPRMLRGDFEPGFYIKHFIKDMTIAQRSAESMGLETPGLALARSLYERLSREGAGDKGTQALYTLYDPPRTGG